MHIPLLNEIPEKHLSKPCQFESLLFLASYQANNQYYAMDSNKLRSQMEIEQGHHIWWKDHIWCFKGFLEKLVDEWVLLMRWFHNTEFLHPTPKRVFIQT